MRIYVRWIYVLVLLLFFLVCVILCVFFFFSSRRRHTRCSRDWSSDVCSSDLKEFLGDVSLSRGVTEEETEFLKKLKFKGKRPNALYYYRELQNLRDPLHFRSS